MKRTAIIALLLLVPGIITAQSLEISTSENDQTYLLAEVNYPDGISVAEEDGTTLITGTYKFASATDNSLKVYPNKDGSFIVRENGVNFLIYDTFGNVKRSISNSSQSEDGESNSELSIDPMGKTVVLYNPRIKYGTNEGSAAQLITSGSNSTNLHYSRERTVSVVEVSPNGEFIAIVTVNSGTDDQIKLLDRFGSELQTIRFDQDVKGVSFSENGLFVTVYSGGRAAVYEIRSGERLSGASFRNTSLKFANYTPEDQTIIGLSGNGNSTITEVELHAVNIEARKIQRKEYSGSLKVKGDITLTRLGRGNYEISGLDTKIILDVSF